mmetsp:Transcript_101961/g.285788  ORF Transcript_101961/g.285788 Transcript_101961/m.285788 type:complete len:248 (+) Transcript_101961:214-957(+)
MPPMRLLASVLGRVEVLRTLRISFRLAGLEVFRRQHHDAGVSRYVEPQACGPTPTAICRRQQLRVVARAAACAAIAPVIGVQQHLPCASERHAQRVVGVLLCAEVARHKNWPLVLPMPNEADHASLLVLHFGPLERALNPDALCSMGLVVTCVQGLVVPVDAHEVGHPSADLPAQLLLALVPVDRSLVAPLAALCDLAAHEHQRAARGTHLEAVQDLEHLHFVVERRVVEEAHLVDQRALPADHLVV